MKKLLVVVAFAFSSCCNVDAQRAAAEVATYDWFAPMMRAYIEADEHMDASAKATHLRGLDAWGQRVAQDAKVAGVR